MPDNFPNILFDKILYFRKEKVIAGEYAKNNARKPICFVPEERDDDYDCWLSDNQTAWIEPSVREVNPNNCEKIELDQVCRNLVFCIALTMIYLPGCG